MHGIVEVITLLLGLQGFGVHHNPKPPTPDQALEFALPAPDIVVHFDAASVIPGNYKVLTHLADQPKIKASPELAKLVRKAVAEIEGPRGMVKAMTGIDIVTDVRDATASFSLVPHSKPKFVIAVHGRFSPIVIDKIAKLAHKSVTQASGGSWIDTGDGEAVAVTKTGVLVAGTTDLIRPRVESTWKPTPHGGGTSLGAAAEVIAGQPVFAVVVTLSKQAREQALKELGKKNFASDVIQRHRMMSFAIYDDGIGWTWLDSSSRGLAAMAQISDGVIDLLRAAQIAPRGFAKIVMGGLESYRGLDRRLDDVIKHRADIWKIVDGYTGDGNFKAQVDKNVHTLKLTVRLTGKHLSDVLPLGGIVPLAAIGFLVEGREMGMAKPQPPTLVRPAPMPPMPHHR